MLRLAPLLLLVTSAFAQNVVLQPVVKGLTQPVALTHAGDTRLFITQQNGLIVIVDAVGVRSTPFLDIRSLVSTGGERGLLSVAFDPHYRDNGRFFVYYTNRNGDITIARYNVSASDPNRADPATAAVLLTIPHPNFANHNGGQLQFGPDGYLYAGTGDGGSAGDPNNNAQNLSQFLGKLLRIDVSGSGYTVPSSNPFVNRGGAHPEIWAYGLRNPWRFSFDRQTGDLWIADVGQSAYEEIDLQPATSIGGENYGWRAMEGMHCYNPSSGCSDPSFTLPVAEYGHSLGCSITGGYRYRGTQVPSLRGTYLYGDYCSGRIWSLAQNGTSWTSHVLMTTSLAISSFGEDLAGELYVLDIGGTVYKITERTVRTRAASH